MEDVLQQVTPIENFLNQVVLFIPKLVVAILIFLVTLYLARLGQNFVKARLERRRRDPELTLLLSRMTQVVFKEFGQGSINATLYFWIDTSEADYFVSIDNVIKGIKRAFEQAGITIH